MYPRYGHCAAVFNHSPGLSWVLIFGGGEKEFYNWREEHPANPTMLVFGN